MIVVLNQPHPIENEIGIEGAKAIAQSFKMNQSLSGFDLSLNRVDEIDNIMNEILLDTNHNCNQQERQLEEIKKFLEKCLKEFNNSSQTWYFPEIEYNRIMPFLKKMKALRDFRAIQLFNKIELLRGQYYIQKHSIAEAWQALNPISKTCPEASVVLIKMLHLVGEETIYFDDVIDKYRLRLLVLSNSKELVLCDPDCELFLRYDFNCLQQKLDFGLTTKNINELTGADKILAFNDILEATKKAICENYHVSEHAALKEKLREVLWHITYFTVEAAFTLLNIPLIRQTMDTMNLAKENDVIALYEHMISAPQDFPLKKINFESYILPLDDLIAFYQQKDVYKDHQSFPMIEAHLMEMMDLAVSNLTIHKKVSNQLADQPFNECILAQSNQI